MNNEKSIFTTVWFWGVAGVIAVVLLLIPAAVRFYLSRPSVQLQSALKQAQDAMVVQDTKQAQEILLGAAESDPSSFEIYEMLLQVYAADENYAAINSLLASLPADMSPDDQLKLRSAGIEYISKAAVRSISASDYETAIALYQSIISAAGGDEALSSPARRKIDELQALIDRDTPYDPSTQPSGTEDTLIARARRASGEEAIELWNQVLAENPQYVDAYSHIADSYAYLQEYAKALDILRTGYDLTGDSLLEEKTELIQRQMAKTGYAVAPETPISDTSSSDTSSSDASASGAPAEQGASAAAAAAGTGESQEANDLLTLLTKALNTNDYTEAIRLMARNEFQNAISERAQTAESDTISISRSSYNARTGTSFLAEAGSDESSELLSGLVEKTTEETDDSVLFEVYLDRAAKTFLVYSGDGTELNVYWPAVTDEMSRTVIGIYGKDRFGYGTYVLSDGRNLSAVEYFAAFAP